MANDDVPEMFYFPVAGRGELCRLISTVGGLKLDDTFPGLPSRSKDFCVFGQLPTLRHGDLMLAQSGAMQKYLAAIAPLYASLSPEQRAIDDMFAAIKEDVVTHFDDNPITLQAFRVFENVLPDDGFVLGLQFPTVADLTILYMLESSGFKPELKKAGVELDNFPKTKALWHRTKCVPSVQQYVVTSTTLPVTIHTGFVCKILCTLLGIKCCGCRSTRRLEVDEGAGHSQAFFLQAPLQSCEVSSAGPPEMFYFPIAGRGELSRLICAAGSLDLRVTFPGKGYEDKVGFFGKLPTLKHGEISLCQSGAIETYLAAISPKFKGLTVRQRAVDNMYIHTKEDILSVCAKVVYGDDAVKRRAKETVSKVFDKFLGPIDRMVPTKGFINGEAFPTVADLALLNLLEATMPFGQAASLAGGINFQERFPKAYALVQRTKQATGVQEYLEASTSMKAAPYVNEGRTVCLKQVHQ